MRKKLRNTKNNQQGRSLTEMLGVLAVIGVLSMAALFGYRYALDKYRANETINELNGYALIVDGQMLRGKTVFDLSEAGNITRLGYPITAYLLNDPMYFELALENVPVGVCKQILNSDWKKPLVIYANDFAYSKNLAICEQDDDGTPASMKFQFYTALTDGVLPYGTCETPADCSGNCVDCQKGLCVSLCTGADRCATDLNSGAEVCCPKDKRSGPYCCPTSVNGWCCDENKENCCPWHKPLRDKNGTCYACDYEAAVDVTGELENCNVCSNREVDGNSCVLGCPIDKPLRGSDGKCHPCVDMNPIMMRAPYNYCQSSCPNRRANGAYDRYCSIPCNEKQFTGEDGKCYDCDDTKLISVSNVRHDGCEKCQQRTVYSDSSYNYYTICIIDCPKGQFKGADGICYDCNYVDPVETGSAARSYCSQICPNRILNGQFAKFCSIPCKSGQFTGSNGLCYDCNDPIVINAGSVGTSTYKDCLTCPNRTDKNGLCRLKCPDGQFRGGDGFCYDCTYSDSVSWGGSDYENECNLTCPNRTATGAVKQWCSLKCEQGMFEGNSGKCYDCLDSTFVFVSDPYMCRQCPERVLYNSLCVLPCPEEAPLRGSDGKCYPCNTDTRVPVNNITDACYECHNERKLDGNYCVLK